MSFLSGIGFKLYNKFSLPFEYVRILNEALFLNSSQICNYEILDDYKLNFSVFNGTISSPSLDGFLNSEITLLKNSSIILTGNTNTNGWFIVSVISHPIVSNEKTLHTLYLLGATREQLTFTVVTQLVFLGIFSSTIGSFLGMIVMISLQTLKAVNVGGIIINPVIIFSITFSNAFIVFLKGTQKVTELYSMFSFK